MAASCSQISARSKDYDAFISFRGADVRNGFLSHLHEALLRNNVNAFVDENLDRGEEITSSLLKTIEESYVSLVILSENYAFSPWCLDELVKIIECKKVKGQKVLPVFYRVDPSDVHELTGRYGDALAKHREEFKDSLYKVENWCRALRETAEMAGLVSEDIRPDSKLIEKIVSCSLKKLDEVFRNESQDSGLVGIDSRIKHVESLLCLESPDVCFVGIWGEGGIGKTTIAAKVFDEISSQFSGSCFVRDIREKLDGCTGPDDLQRAVFSKLLGKDIYDVGRPISMSSSVRKMLSRRKVLVVLDDVSDLKEIEFVVGKIADYGPGSRIIMTSRNKQLLNYVGAEMYEVKPLNPDEALRLFCFYSLKQNGLSEEFSSIAKRAVRYARGIPLTLKVLGCNLYGKSVREWEDELGKLEKPSDEIALRKSFDGLSSIEQKLLVDIVCFFRGTDRVDVETTMETHGPRMRVSRLVDKPVIYISFNKVHMHDPVRRMSKHVTYEENQIGHRSRLRNLKDMFHVLIKDKAMEAIREISLDLSKIRDMILQPQPIPSYSRPAAPVQNRPAARAQQNRLAACKMDL